MTIELTITEAELLIAVLAFAEGAADLKPGMPEAIEDLRGWRTALLRAYLKARTQ